MRLVYLSTLSLLGGVFWGDYKTFGRLSLAGRSTALGLGFEGLWSHSISRLLSGLPV